MGIWNHWESLRDLGGRSLEPILEDKRAASVLGGRFCLVRFFVFSGCRRPSPDLGAMDPRRGKGPQHSVLADPGPIFTCSLGPNGTWV